MSAPDARVQFHLFELTVSQFTGLVQYVFRHRKFAHVMKERSSFDRLDQAIIRLPRIAWLNLLRMFGHFGYGHE